jgi:hypothetical protein
MKRFASTLRELRYAPKLKENDGIDVNFFFNYYGTLGNSQQFNTPGLVKKASWWDKLLRRK